MTSHLLLHFTFIHSHTKNMTSQIRTEWNRRKTGKQKKVGKEHAFSKNWILLNNFFYICYNHLPDSWAFWTSLAILNESQFALTANQTLHTHTHRGNEWMRLITLYYFSYQRNERNYWSPWSMCSIAWYCTM